MTKAPPQKATQNAQKAKIEKPITKQQAINVVANLLSSAGFPVDEKVIKRQRKNDLINIVNMASLVSRTSLQSYLGQSFYGKRDLYDVLGWKKDLDFPDFLTMYERNGIASRVVDLKANECWRKFPVLHDGKTAEDYQDETPFLKEWLELVDTLNLQSVFNELDIALGISRFSLIVIGVEGTEKYSEPLKPGKGKKIKFLRVLDEGQVTIPAPIQDIYSPRYGMPEIYHCQFEDGGAFVPVHWTRVVHFKQGRGRSNLYGVPGLQKSYNNLQDLEKVTGSSSEAFWQHIRQIIVLSAKEGFNLPAPGTPEYEKYDEKIEALEHHMRRVIELKNMDVSFPSSQVIDGSKQHDLLIAEIAGTEGIPQRILVGSERGELASTQDVLNMNNATAARQQKTCTPWLRQFVQYLYTYQFIPPPSSGKFQVEWLSLYELTPLEKLDLGIKKADFLDRVTGGIIDNDTVAMLIEETLDGYVMPEMEEEEEKPAETDKDKDKNGWVVVEDETE